jgi:hypothetical protein
LGLLQQYRHEAAVSAPACFKSATNADATTLPNVPLVDVWPPVRPNISANIAALGADYRGLDRHRHIVGQTVIAAAKMLARPLEPSPSAVSNCNPS